MKKNVSSIAIVTIVTLMLFLCHSITPAKSETGSKEQKVRVQSNKEVESVERELPTPKTNKLYIKRKLALKPLSETFREMLPFQKAQPLPFNNKQAYRMPTLRVRKDMDCKILSMRMRKDIDYKILDLFPKNHFRKK